MSVSAKARERAIERVEVADRSFRRTLARAHQAGVPLRALARYAGVSHVAVRSWIDSVPPADLDRFAGLDGVPIAERRQVAKPVPAGRPGARGRRTKRKS